MGPGSTVEVNYLREPRGTATVVRLYEENDDGKVWTVRFDTPQPVFNERHYHEDWLTEIQNEPISGPLPPRSYLPTSTPPGGPQEPREAPQCVPDDGGAVCDYSHSLTARLKLRESGEHCGHWLEVGMCCYCGAD